MKLFKGLDDNQFFMTIWAACITGSIIIATLIAYSSYSEDLIIADLVKSGHDPIELSCVYQSSSYTESSCLQLILQRNKNVPE